MTTNDSQGKIVLLFVLLLTFFAVAGYRIYQLLNPDATAVVADASQPQLTIDDIARVELIDVNFWEARFKVLYQQNSARAGGYLTVTENRWSPNIGIMTQPGVHQGVTLLTRDFDNTAGYEVTEVVANMYDPYRADHSFALKSFPVTFQWPALDELPAFSPESQSPALSSIAQLQIYRNVPDYVRFAETLTRQGFPPQKMYMMLAVCPRCKGGLIYGGGVTKEQLRVVLEALKAHNFPLATVFYNPDPGFSGVIQIGNTPPPRSKPLWANLDQVLTAADDESFFTALGFPLAAPEARAKELYLAARDALDSGRNLDGARRMLDEALTLDDGLAPIYVEMARYTMKTQPFSEDMFNDQIRQTAEQAEQFIQSGLSIDATMADAYVLLGYTQTIQREFGKAEKAYAKAEELGTQDLWLHYNRALLTRFQGDLDATGKNLEKLLAFGAKQDRNDRPLEVGLKALAKVYLQQDDIEKALATYEYRRSQFPAHQKADTEYLTLLIAHGGDQGKIREIIDQCRQCFSEIEPHANAMTTLIEASRLVDEDPERARRAVMKAQSFRSHFPTVIADLVTGQHGREAVSTLMDRQLLDLATVEITGSVITPLLDQPTLAGLELMLKHGANPNILSGYEQMSPLMYAVAMQRLDAIGLLLGHGAEPGLENRFGMSAYNLAQSLNNPVLTAKLDATRNKL